MDPTSGPVAVGFVGAAVRLKTDDVAVAAKRLFVPVPTLLAVLDVESSGSGFDDQGRPKILFEPHIFYRELAGNPALQAAAVKAGLAYAMRGTLPYPRTSEGNYQRLKRACLIDPDAAMRSASWGVAQVMGFNYALCGYDTVGAMVRACMDSEADQFGLLLTYCDKNGLLKALRCNNFTAFALGYNGKGAVAEYSAKLAAAFSHHSAARGVWQKALAGQPALLAGQPATVQQPMNVGALNDAEWLRIRAGG